MIHCPKHGVMTGNPDTQYSSMCLNNAQSIHTAAFCFDKDGIKISTSGWRRWVWFDHCWYLCARSEITPDTTVTQMLDRPTPPPQYFCISKHIKLYIHLTVWVPQTTCDVKNVFGCWYGAQCLRAVMWESRGCEGGATFALPLVLDKSCERPRGWLLFDRLGVKHALVSQASQGHRLGDIPSWLLSGTEASPSPSTPHTSTHHRPAK